MQKKCIHVVVAEQVEFLFKATENPQSFYFCLGEGWQRWVTGPRARAVLDDIIGELAVGWAKHLSDPG